jgi:hypothetical protein
MVLALALRVAHDGQTGCVPTAELMTYPLKGSISIGGVTMTTCTRLEAGLSAQTSDFFSPL